MTNRESALTVARRSPRVARLLSAAIISAARLTLNINIREGEAASLARDYLPSDAINQLQKNLQRSANQPLPANWRQVGSVSRTILDGVARTADHGLKAGGPMTWLQRIKVRLRAWTAEKRITKVIRSRGGQGAQDDAQRASSAAEMGRMIEELAARNEQFIECARLRPLYLAKIESLRLPDAVHAEATKALDDVINYHLAVLAAEQLRQPPLAMGKD